MKKNQHFFLRVCILLIFCISTIGNTRAQEFSKQSIHPIQDAQFTVFLGTYEKGEITSVEISLSPLEEEIPAYSWITILFPEPYTITNVEKEDFTFSGIEASDVQKTENNNIRLQTPITLTGMLSIAISSHAHIQNPLQGDSFVFTLLVEKWEQFFESSKVLLSTPLNSIAIEIQGDTKSNQHGWFSKPPIIDVTSKRSKEIYIAFDEEDFIKLEDSSLQISEGTHILYFYGVRFSGLKEQIRSIQWKVDPYPPSCTQVTPGQRSWINQQDVDVSFFVTSISPAFVSISDEVYSIENGVAKVFFHLKPGKNTISYSVINQAGYSITDELILFVDVTPPSIALYSPTEGQIHCGYTLNVSGKTEPGCILTINQNVVKMDSYGNFSFDTIKMKEGKNVVQIRCEDRAGNVTTLQRTFYHYAGNVIEIQMSQKKILINEKEISVQPFPFRDSQNGEVYVPLRLFAETLDYSLLWDSKQNAAILEKNEIQIYVRPNDSIIKIKIGDSIQEEDIYYAPTIVEDTIVVPIEFTKKILGAEVQYDPKQESMYIIFCPERRE
jgi:hypothetical protein